MIKLGIIGFSKGNGHPYSWSAIINGYSSFEMEKCEFPVIFNYLSEQKYPQHFIKNAKVTHIWTQERTISEKISKASKIKYIVENIDDMIGLVDGVLLARDDAENHIKYAENFIKNGIPIYIDKPLSLSLKGAEKIFSFEKFPGQIFSCSALKFSTEMMLDENDINNLGKIFDIINV